MATPNNTTSPDPLWVTRITFDTDPEVTFSNGLTERLEDLTRDSEIVTQLSSRDAIAIGEHRGWTAVNHLMIRKDKLILALLKACKIPINEGLGFDDILRLVEAKAH